MEAAVCLSDLIDPEIDDDQLWTEIEAFLSGYNESVTLSPEEVEALPFLVVLRRLDVFIHFLGRYEDGIDGFELVEQYIRKAHALITWIERSIPKFAKSFKSIADHESPSQ